MAVAYESCITSVVLCPLSLDDFRPPLQKLSDGSVSLHQQRHGVPERPVPHYDQRLCKFLSMSFSPFTSQFIFHECRSHLCPVVGLNTMLCCIMEQKTLGGVPDRTFCHRHALESNLCSVLNHILKGWCNGGGLV